MNTNLEPAAFWNRAENGNIRLWTSANEDGLRLAVEAGFKLDPLYDEATVRAMIEDAWQSGYYDAGYTNDSAYADRQARDFADAAMSNHLISHQAATDKRKKSSKPRVFPSTQDLKTQA